MNERTPQDMAKDNRAEIMETRAEEMIANRYGFHPATDSTDRLRHQMIRQTFAATAKLIEGILPDGREKSLAHTALQEASMWANASLALSRPLEET